MSGGLVIALYIVEYGMIADWLKMYIQQYDACSSTVKVLSVAMQF